MYFSGIVQNLYLYGSIEISVRTLSIQCKCVQPAALPNLCN